MSSPQDDPARFINREWSWLAFNRRVLEEAMDPSNPLLERLKFSCIVSSNLDEFFMVRVAGLKNRIVQRDAHRDDAGLTPGEQIDGISERAHAQVADLYANLTTDLLPALAEHGIRVLACSDVTPPELQHLENRFEQEVFPVLTPMAIDPTHPFPMLTNLTLNLAVLLGPAERQADPRLAVVQVPGVVPRLMRLPRQPGASFVLLEDVIRTRLDRLFPGQLIVDSVVFRLTRDSELEFDDEGGEDRLQVLEAELRKRRTNPPVRLEVADGVSDSLLRLLMDRLTLADSDVYHVTGPLDARSLMALADLPGYDALINEPLAPQMPSQFDAPRPVWEVLAEGDVLLHHPYDSFDPVVRLIDEAADDPDVMAIKQTLYRTSGQSPIIRALARAAENNKQVTVLVELMARFDEKRNIGWAKQLENAGAHVIYGLAGLKTHAKIALIVRREPDGIRRYLHLGTGNYNDRTARLYTDMGLLTCDEVLGADASAFFNTITGYSDPPVYQKLVMAPIAMRERIIELIRREADRSSAGQPAEILAKMNSLVDRRIIQALCEASEAGVAVKLNVRGVCCLRPGVDGVSDHVRVVSIVDRFLEHSRAFYFLNAGSEDVYMSSADWMPRNLDKRVELMFPVEDERCKAKAIAALRAFFADNVRSRRLMPDGSYQRVTPPPGDDPLRCQLSLHEQAVQARQHTARAAPVEFRPQTSRRQSP